MTRLVLTNDRPQPASDRSGSGLAGLSERLAEVGGTLSIERGDDTFTLTATVDAAGLKADLRRHGILAGQADATRGAEHRFVLAIRGAFASHHDYLAFRDLVSGIPGVQSVWPVSIAPGLSEWRLLSSEGAPAIARELSKRRFKGATLRIVQSDAETIVATFNAKGGFRD